MDDEGVGGSRQQHVQHSVEDADSETHSLVQGDVPTGELHEGHVLTSKVMDHVGAAETNPGGQRHHWGNNAIASGSCSPHQASQQLARHYLRVAQRVEDGNVAV